MKLFCNFAPNKQTGMTAEEIMQLISNLGFPVVMCGALFYSMTKQEERHTQETDKLRETIAANTTVLTELCTLIKQIAK